jgi:hypothetical protein
MLRTVMTFWRIYNFIITQYPFFTSDFFSLLSIFNGKLGGKESDRNRMFIGHMIWSTDLPPPHTKTKDVGGIKRLLHIFL